MRNRLRAEGQGIDATVSVGKEGLTAGVVDELDAQLKRHHLVKVRIQRSAIGPDKGSKDAQALELAERLGADLVERRGHTVLLYRRRARGRGTQMAHMPDSA
ncbi:MAG: RNA-binding protein [Thermoplasmata archaeon]|nr:YhbY family RNA-binding protein [Thermoplasmata archaeon]NIS10376.1 YhbY family RNA-binding protein [Thermoplasmata archaeon]NIS18366.1 YhbY family RNA-binding protein [Thermoplasmata archaeon]NIT75341.1 YhbY family RNA-binding protein [Thermoplasmata archaeon]NIU47521.1 YhbY family RNA-binding protein [Thermoplasmata archaeon]